MKNPFKELTKFELGLWLSSVLIVGVSFLLLPNKDYLTLVASLIGVTALIFVAKGYVIGQVICVVFAAFYGIISFHFRYYGEVITYLCMTTPMAIMAVVSWLKHPYKGTKVVEVNKMTREELKRKLEELENREFIINMVDRWTNEDRELLRRIREEKNTIKKELAIA